MNPILEFNKRGNATIVDPEFIASVRKKLALDQRQAAEISGASISCLLRKRRDKPPLAPIKSLKVLDVIWSCQKEVRRLDRLASEQYTIDTLRH